MITAKVITEFDESDLLEYVRSKKRVYVWYNKDSEGKKFKKPKSMVVYYDYTGYDNVVYLVNHDFEDSEYIPISGVVAFLEEKIS